jgi:hypothetical protein
MVGIGIAGSGCCHLSGSSSAVVLVMPCLTVFDPNVFDQTVTW